MCKIKLPKGETGFVAYHDSAHVQRYLLTANQTRTRWTMFSVDDGTLKKLGCGANPLDLEEKYVRLQ